MTTLHGDFQVASWDENAYDECDGRRLTKASVTQRFEGDIAGEGAAEEAATPAPEFVQI